MPHFYRFIANTLFVLHFIIGGFLVFGWFFPEIKYFYLAVLISWPACWIFLGYCPITKWEFMFRKKYNPQIDTNEEFIRHYVQVFFQKDLPSRTIFTVGLVVFALLLALCLMRAFLF